jgi:hypothetical protein
VLRLNTASMTYRLPDEWTRMLKSSSATLAIQGSNLGLWTQYRGRDPGVNSTPVGEQLTDNGLTIPQPRKYAASLRLTF